MALEFLPRARISDRHNGPGVAGATGPMSPSQGTMFKCTCAALSTVVVVGMLRLIAPLALIAALTSCTFQGGGIAPFNPAPVAPAEPDLDVPYVPTPRPVVEA